MKFVKKRTLTLSLFLLLAALSGATAANKSVEELFNQIELEYKVFTLPNGLTTLVYPDHSSPEVYVGVYYRVGSKDEPADKTGFAHLYEHLMFQGTQNAPGDYFAHIGKIGASGINGYTTKEYTNYHQSVPSEALDAALWLESDRMAHIISGITQKILDEQRDVVKNEKRQNKVRKTAVAFHDHFFPKGHPYDHSVIGSMKDLNNASLKDVHKWFSDYYGATNAVLVLAGDITVAQAEQKVAHYFSDVKPGKRVSRLEQYIPEFDQIKKVTVYDNSPRTTVARLWGIPNASSEDYVLMNYVSTTIAGDPNSPITKRLKDDLNYVTNIAVTTDAGSVNSSIMLSYDIREESGATKEQIDAIINEELATYFKKGPSKAILNSLSTDSDADFVRAAKEANKVADFLTQSILLHDDPEFFRIARQWERNATPSQLKALAKKWLGKPYLEITRHPEPEAREMTAVVNRSAIPTKTEAINKANKIEPAVIFPKFKQATLENGLKIVLTEEEGAPSVDVVFQIETGSAIDEKYAPNVAGLAFGLMTFETKHYRENQLIQAQRALAMNMASEPGEYFSLVRLNALTSNLDESLSLTSEILINPTYPEKALVTIREQITAEFEELEKSPDLGLASIFDRALWGKDHPLGRILSKSEVLDGLSRDNIVRFHKNEIGPNNTTVYMNGDVTLENAKRLLEKHFGDWKKVTPSSPAAVGKPQSASGKIILVDNPVSQSAFIATGHAIAPFDKNVIHVQDIANEVISGSFESRINMNLREDKGWSYGVDSEITRRLYSDQYFFLSTAVQTDKVGMSLLEIHKELNQYVTDNPITQEEFNRVREAWTKSIPSSFSRSGAYIESAITAKAYGLELDHDEGFINRVNETTVEQVRTAAKDLIKPKQLFWVVVGDLSQFEDELRDLGIGSVEVWDVDGNLVR